MFGKCRDVRCLDPEKGVNKLFENVSCKRRIQNFFQGVERRAHLDIFFGRVTSRQIDKQKQLQGGRGNATAKIFLKFRQRKWSF